MTVSRRGALAGGVAALAAGPVLAKAVLAPATVTERWIDVGGAELYVRDTGGNRPIVLLAHPATGSARVWDDQQARLAAAGFRVIAWSRRDYAGSRKTGDAADPGAVPDLLHLIDGLGIQRFHAIGSAAGGGLMLDFAVAHPERVRSLVIANSVGNLADAAFRHRWDGLRPAPFNDLPASFRELGPIYRAANPEGVARWEALEHASRSGPLGPPPRSTLAWSDLDHLTPPSLWITGDADFYAPPPLFTEHKRRVTHGTFVTIAGAGHSAYWEYPELFASYVIPFLKRHG